MTTRIAVNIADLAKLTELICDIDFANAAGAKAAITEMIGDLHNTVEKMLGVHADKIYTPDEELSQTGASHDH